MSTPPTRVELAARLAGIRTTREAYEAGAPAPIVNDANTPRPIVVRLADVTPEVVRWLWMSRLALGKLTLLIGDPGLGKSWITLFIAAALSVGRRWPDGTEAPPPMNTLLLTAEDGLSDTIRPRLDALGADPARIHHLAVLKAGDQERCVQLADIAMIEQAIVETDARLLIVDPVSAYVGQTDSHKDAPVRSLLAPLAAMVERRGVAALGVMHLKKNAQGPAVHRVGGSIAFAAAARIVLAVAADHERGGRRVLASVKQNLAIDPPALGYSLEEGRLVWDAEPVPDVDINALLSGPGDHRERGEQTDAEHLISGLLEDHTLWPLDAKDAIDAAQAQGIPDRTMRWTARRMGIRIARTGFGRGGKWLWHRPDAIPAIVEASSPRTDTVAAIAAIQNPEQIAANNNIEAIKNPPPRAREADAYDDDASF